MHESGEQQRVAFPSSNAFYTYGLRQNVAAQGIYTAYDTHVRDIARSARSQSIAASSC